MTEPILIFTEITNNWLHQSWIVTETQKKSERYETFQKQLVQWELSMKQKGWKEWIPTNQAPALYFTMDM